jgi:hypothetical protein
VFLFHHGHPHVAKPVILIVPFAAMTRKPRSGTNDVTLAA